MNINLNETKNEKFTIHHLNDHRGIDPSFWHLFHKSKPLHLLIMELSKKNVTVRGDWEDGIYTGKLEADSNGFWSDVTFKAYSNDGYITDIEIQKWASGYVDSEDNECILSESMDNLLESKIKFYIKNAVL